MDSIFFSVCIPNFNYGHLITETIQSVLDQDYSNFEIIVSDNCSSDDSEKVVLAIGDSRIKFFRNNFNIGFSPNLDKATIQANGDYLILLSSDDLMLPGALRMYADNIAQQKGSSQELVLMSSVTIIDENGIENGAKSAATGDVLNYFKANKNFDRTLPTNILAGHEVLRALISGTFQPAGQFLSTCYSRNLYHSVEGYNTPMSVYPDAFFSHKILMQNPKVIYVNRALFAYRVHGINNLAQIQTLNNIKSLTDNYVMSQSFPHSLLQTLNLSKQAPQLSFINNIILNPGWYSILRGHAVRGLRYLAFGYASYPAMIIRRPRFYASVLLVPFTPILKLTYIFFKKFK
ncbi:MAG: glycosyltransferase family 2 protein [Ferruginibacter sp.]|nr:glycosyltransferase family 2 protein [Ferruginibacter sp.]